MAKKAELTPEQRYANRRACQENYRHRVHRFTLQFSLQDTDAFEWFDQQEDKGTYLKNLILADKAKNGQAMNKMIFVFNDEKAHAIGFTAQDCYAAVDKVFAKYGIVPMRQGVYEAPDDQNTFNAFGAATWLTSSDWFLKVIDSWMSFEDGGWGDCLAAYYKYAKIND